MEKIDLEAYPLVSICMPCHNASKYIQETINCLIRQDYSNLEIIVVDDHSSDDSYQKIEDLAKKNLNIRCYKAKGKGAAAARNQAYDLSKGDFIVFFDADDLVDSRFISSQLDVLNFSKEDCVVSAWGRFSVSKETFTLDTTSICQDLSFHDWIINYWTKASNMTIPGRLLMSRQLKEKSGKWNEELSLNDDFQFFSKLFSKVKMIRFNKKGKLMYRSNINGLSSKTKSHIAQSSNLKAIIEAVDTALVRFDDLPTKQACVNLLQQFIFDIYPSHDSLKNIANQKIATIGIRPSITFTAGGYTKFLSQLIGWKNTKRLKHAINQYANHI